MVVCPGILNFFSKQYLSDKGFVAVLHSGQFSHASAIHSAAEWKGVFKPVQTYTILLPKPLWKASHDFQVSCAFFASEPRYQCLMGIWRMGRCLTGSSFVQVFNLAPDIFCKSSSDGSIPKDENFEALTSTKDISMSSLISLSHPPKNSGRDMSFSGSGRVSVRFMQTVIELLTRPGDVLFDWSVGEGVSFFAGDYCGRRVIVLEDRLVYGEAASEALRDVHSRNLIVEAIADVSTHDLADERQLVVDIPEDEEDEDPYAILGDED